ncbi:MAG: hypothetical protein N4A76_16840 [Firmicutes bacterium]|jgi:hypothetical protein|nr:hypothetical protein [Bacillota bacterium]
MIVRRISDLKGDVNMGIKGQCGICGKEYSKVGFPRHLSSCISKSISNISDKDAKIAMCI